MDRQALVCRNILEKPDITQREMAKTWIFPGNSQWTGKGMSGRGIYCRGRKWERKTSYSSGKGKRAFKAL